jgi:ABC-type bacteriocin/lantibiotic exporter with double-glycine peptidase domain
LAILAGRLQPGRGSVHLDGFRPDEHRPDVLHDQVVLVEQRGTLFRGTILQNISSFRPERRDQAVAVARAIGLGEVVSALPAGYRTLVGDGAHESLPPGSVQLISLVRAFAGAPRILLLDEANTALDDRAENGLKRLIGDRKGVATTIIVTHRPSLMRLADRTLELRDGRLWPVVRTPGPGSARNPARAAVADA